MSELRTPPPKNAAIASLLLIGIFIGGAAAWVISESGRGKLPAAGFDNVSPTDVLKKLTDSFLTRRDRVLDTIDPNKSA
jgi:hypothetical protein